MQITMQRILVPRRPLLIRCPREVWERAGERTGSRRVSLGDVTAHGRVQKWPSRKRLGTRPDATLSPSLVSKNKTEIDSRLLKILSLERLTTLTFFYNMIFLAKFVVSRCAFCKLGRNFEFFCSVNHRRGPLRKHKFTCDWCISIHFVCFCVSRFAACDRPVQGNYWLSFLRRFFWSFSFLSLARIKQCLPPALHKKFTHYRDFLRYTLRAKFRRDEYPCYKTDLSWSWLARICPSITVPMSTLISPILKPRSHIVPNKPERVQAEADN